VKRITNLLGLITRPKPQVGVTPSDVVWAENKWRLLRYRPRPEGLSHHTPLLLVPSLINRHYVLDLMPGKSFAESLVAAGHDVFVIDWGTPEDEVRFIVRGHGIFHIHPPTGPVFSIEVSAGDLINVPAGTPHWFDLCADRNIRAIRLFREKAGWSPLYTGSDIATRFEPLCFGPSHLPPGTRVTPSLPVLPA
jgi:mannose-6-phosphate isomerase-like protein (cupin superfamily)